MSAAGVIGAILAFGAVLAYAGLLSTWVVGGAYSLLLVAGVVAGAMTVRQQKRLTAVAQRLEELEAAASRADVGRKDSLLASLSHDLRTPLTTIKGIAHEIVHGGDPERAIVIEEEADRLAVLVDGMLDLSRLDVGELPVNIELNTIDELVGVALQQAESALRPHPIQVDLCGSALLVGRFDFAHSLRILVNLLDNAAKYSAPEAPIELVVRQSRDRLYLLVSDRGRGIALNDADKIFEPFYRAPGRTADVRGAGLGLAIARRLARAQGGDLTATPRDGGGTTFVVELMAGELPTA